MLQAKLNLVDSNNQRNTIHEFRVKGKLMATLALLGNLRAVFCHLQKAVLNSSHRLPAAAQRFIQRDKIAAYLSCAAGALVL